MESPAVAPHPLRATARAIANRPLEKQTPLLDRPFSGANPTALQLDFHDFGTWNSSTCSFKGLRLSLNCIVTAKTSSATAAASLARATFWCICTKRLYWRARPIGGPGAPREPRGKALEGRSSTASLRLRRSLVRCRNGCEATAGLSNSALYNSRNALLAVAASRSRRAQASNGRELRR